MTFQELYDLLEEKSLTVNGIAKAGKITKDEAQALVDTYIARGDIVSIEQDKYTTTDKAGVILCTITTARSNGFFVRSVKNNQEYYISGSSTKGLIVSDLIYVKPEGNSGDAIYIGFYKRKTKIVGNLYRKPKEGYELLSSVTKGTKIKIFVDNDPDEINAGDGDLVEARITMSKTNSIRVEVETLLSKATDVGADITQIIAEKDAPFIFPDEVLAEAKAIPQEINKDDIQNRVDYRDELVVTIDGADALDFDDAVQVSLLPNNSYKIVVHIADVSHYVTPGTAIDTEADNRGTSIYVADRVVPMLPTELSNGICSLNPNVDRFTLSVEMSVDSRGNVFQSSIHKGVIRSKARLTYTEVNDLLEGEESDLPEEIQTMLKTLDKAAQIIRARRTKNGALDLDSTELKFYLDSMGRPLEVAKRVQKEGEKLIEDLMIIANVSVAKMLEDAGIPTLFRIHENPPTAKIDEFRAFARKLYVGKDFPSIITPKALQSWLESIDDEEKKKTVSRLMLRSLAKARYSPDNAGHFGLAEDDYLHFTSPIRRYPDLIVHRCCKEYLIGKKRVPSDLYDYLTLEGEHTSYTERRATEIERAVDDLESTKYMTKHLEEYFDAKVTGFAKFGMFVELENGIDACLQFNHMAGDYYVFKDKSYEVRGTETRSTRFLLGDKIRVISLSADIETRRIDVCNEQYYRENVENLSTETMSDLKDRCITYKTDSQYRNSRYSRNSDNNERRSSYGQRDRKRSYDNTKSSNGNGKYFKKSSSEGRKSFRKDDRFSRGNGRSFGKPSFAKGGVRKSGGKYDKSKSRGR